MTPRKTLYLTAVLGLTVLVPAERVESQRRGAGLWEVSIPRGDMDAEVGHPFVARVYGSCETKTTREPWSYTFSISGTLPPGVTLYRDRIEGIPTERGHYIVQSKLSNSYCNGESYQEHEGELRIHVSGSGRVIR